VEDFLNFAALSQIDFRSIDFFFILTASSNSAAAVQAVDLQKYKSRVQNFRFSFYFSNATLGRQTEVEVELTIRKTEELPLASGAAGPGRRQHRRGRTAGRHAATPHGPMGAQPGDGSRGGVELQPAAARGKDKGVAGGTLGSSPLASAFESPSPSPRCRAPSRGSRFWCVRATVPACLVVSLAELGLEPGEVEASWALEVWN